MVFESLIDPKTTKHKLIKMFLAGVVYSTLAMVLSLFLFKEHASIIIVAITVLASSHLMYAFIKNEEEKDLQIKSERLLLKEHGTALSYFTFLFLGFVVSFTLWYSFMPSNLAEMVFSVQIETINSINPAATGNFINVAGDVFDIFFANLKLLLVALLFSFLFGFGAIFILTWNASVIAVAIGLFIKGFGGAYFPALAWGLARYLTHGIPEIFAYFMAGLGGGIISIAIIRHHYKSHKFKHILADSLDLIIGSVIVLFLAAMIEVFITPLFFA